jgi:Reverse transcriptase (RNA-dependent DNA polymerase)
MYGVDFQETFSPVAKLNIVRVLLPLAANMDWPLHQFDVKNVFLHGEIKEEIYMDLPPGFGYSGPKNAMCKLKKALYGLKQSPRAWFGIFSGAMKKYGFDQCDSNHTLFIKRKGDKLTMLIIYVDDMIITGNDEEEMHRLEEKLSQEFETKNLGRLKYFLGIEVMRSEEGIFLSQRKYVLNLLKELGMLECKPTDSPMVPNTKFEVKPDQIPENKERYQRLVGKLIYLSHTRPDIAYAVGVASQFIHSPSKEHMDPIIRIVKYLKGSPGRGILFKSNGHLDIMGYSDANWAGSNTDKDQHPATLHLWEAT